MCLHRAFDTVGTLYGSARGLHCSDHIHGRFDSACFLCASASVAALKKRRACVRTLASAVTYSTQAFPMMPPGYQMGLTRPT